MPVGFSYRIAGASFREAFECFLSERGWIGRDTTGMDVPSVWKRPADKYWATPGVAVVEQFTSSLTKLA